VKQLILFSGFLFVTLGIITIYLGKKKHVNPIIGFRFGPTMRDPEIWKTVNIHTGIILIIHGTVATIAGIILFQPDISSLIIIVTLPLFIQLFYGILKAYQLEEGKRIYDTTKNPKELYDEILNAYRYVYGGRSKLVLASKIESYTKKGLTQKEATLRLAKKEKLIL
jgi:hypothetical protein